jgi:hypothetical protein
MPVSGVALTAVHFFATDSDGGKTGDKAQFTLKIIEDGSIGAVAGSITEVDATNAPGMYSVPISAAENTASMVTLCGVSSTAGVTINPVSWTNISNVAAISGSTSSADNLETAAASDTLTSNVKQVNGSTAGASALALGAASMLDHTCDAGSTTSSIVADAGLSSVDDFYNDRMLIFISGDLQYSARAIADYDGGSLTFSVSPSFTSAPADGDQFLLV